MNGEKEARGRFTRCVNHCEGKMERQKGQGADLMRWKKSTWRALSLSLALLKLGRQEGRGTERRELTSDTPHELQQEKNNQLL